jgi:hypothetical protein
MEGHREDDDEIHRSGHVIAARIVLVKPEDFAVKLVHIHMFPTQCV